MFEYSRFENIEGQHLVLSELKSEEITEIAESLFSPSTWVFTHRGINTIDKCLAYLQSFIEKAKRKESLALTARIKKTNEIVAISCFHSAPANFSKVTIGFTWVADKWMRTFVNTEMKYLMIKYAFDVMGVKRVDFLVDPVNEKSNLAVLRIGAMFEGTLRKWQVLGGGDDLGHRNIYSIIDDDWPVVEKHISSLISKYRH